MKARGILAAIAAVACSAFAADADAAEARLRAASFQPERVVFATGMPFYDPATFVSNIQYDETLDAHAKELICGDNLRRLMEAAG